MGPTHPRNSTRARKAHPPKKSRRTPAPPPEAAKRKERALREGIKSFLAADQIARDAVHHLPEPTLKPPRTRPTPHEVTEAFRRAREQHERAEAMLRAAEPARKGAVKPATAGESVSVSATALREIRKILVITRAVVASCARALDSYPDTDDIQLTLEEDVVQKLSHLDVALRLIVGNQPFEALLRVES